MALQTATRTPLFDSHVRLGARMTEFGGYAMPLLYAGIREEHVAVRERVGMFDLSHMGEIRCRGRGAEATVQRLVANDVAQLRDGGALYAVMCNVSGGIVDDVVVYRDAADDFLVVVNAACHDKDFAWMAAHTGPQTTLVDESAATALIAVQGPLAVSVVSGLADTDLEGLARFRSRTATVAGVTARVARTGYTGEDGFELYVSGMDASRLWEAFLAAGVAPAGLGARDTLRLEAGLRLYGQDLDETVDPFSCGLGWTVKLDGGDFIGAAALRALDRHRPRRRFVGLTLTPRSIARHGDRVLLDGAVAGVVTSGTFSFTLGTPIATASVQPEAAERPTLDVSIRGGITQARTVPLPFYRRPGSPRGGRRPPEHPGFNKEDTHD